MMKLNELISVVDESACTCAIKINKSVYGEHSDIYHHAELYEVIRVYVFNDVLIIEVE